MKIPEKDTGPHGRHALYRNVIRQCEYSREGRAAVYRRLRNAYLTGTEDGARVRYNKIKEHIAFSSAILYSPEHVKFGLALPPHHGEVWLPELTAAREELHRVWHDTEAGLVYDMGVTWAHVYPTVVFKEIVSENQVTTTLVPDPSDIGLLHEHLTDWDTQEAIVHWYVMDLARFRRVVMAATAPGGRRDALIQMAEDHATPGIEATASAALPPAVQSIIFSGQGPNIAAGVPTGLGYGDLAMPRVSDPVVKLAELWIKDDEIDDYRVVTDFLPTEEILWDPRNPLLSGAHPFHPLTLDMTPGYAWGWPLLYDLLPLQSWYLDKLESLDDREGREIDPPIVFKGVSQITDEDADRFRRRGGYFTLTNPAGEVKAMPPSPVPDQFGILDRIDMMFARAGGLPKSTTGQGEAGTRGGEHQMVQAQLGAGPTEKQAMRVQRCLETIATNKFRLHARVSEVTLRKEDQTQFLLAQIPWRDVVARVWAHSQSPLYRQQLRTDAKLAKDAGAIDNEDYLRFLDLPGTDTDLIPKARKLAKAAAERSDRILKLKETEAEAKVLRAKKK